MHTYMSVIMSNNKKTQKKQAKPKRFEMLSHEERMKMSYKDIQTHLVDTEIQEDKHFEEWKVYKIYRQRTEQIARVIRYVQMEERHKGGK